MFNKRFLLAIVVVIVVALGISFVVARNQGSSSVIPSSKKVSTTPGISGAPTSSVKETGNTREYTIEMKNGKYSLVTIAANVGDTVKITLKNNDTSFRTFNIDEYNIDSGVLSVGDSVTFSFVATKSGSFDYYSGSPLHHDEGFSGALIVK